MAKDDEKKPAVEAEKPVAPAKEIDPHAGLVRVSKGDQVLYVHPTCVSDHEKAEWKVD